MNLFIDSLLGKAFDIDGLYSKKSYMIALRLSSVLTAICIGQELLSSQRSSEFANTIAVRFSATFVLQGEILSS